MSQAIFIISESAYGANRCFYTNDVSLIDLGAGAVPIIAIEFVASGVLDTRVLPYTIYRQNKDGSIEIFR